MLNITHFIILKLYRASFNLVVDILSGAVLQPLIDLLADPDTINLFIDEGFSPEPSKTFEKKSGNDVEFLQNFITSHHSPSQSVKTYFLSRNNEISCFWENAKRNPHYQLMYHNF